MTNQQENWADEFDKQFPYLNARKVSIKAFISDLLTKQRDEDTIYFNKLLLEQHAAGHASLQTELREKVEERMCALGAVIDPMQAYGSIQNSIYRHNPPDPSPAKHEALGQVRGFEVLLSLLDQVK